MHAYVYLLAFNLLGFLMSQRTCSREHVRIRWLHKPTPEEWAEQRRRSAPAHFDNWPQAGLS